GDALLRDGLANRRFDDSRYLNRIRDQLDVVAAFLEERLRMGFLKIAGTNLGTGNMRRDGHHRHAVAMAIKEAIDQMQIAGAAAPGAYSELARQLRLRAGGKRRDFLVPDGNPLDLLAHAQLLGDGIEGIPHQSINTAHAGSFERLNYSVRNIGHTNLHCASQRSG